MLHATIAQSAHGSWFMVHGSSWLDHDHDDIIWLGRGLHSISYLKTKTMVCVFLKTKTHKKQQAVCITGIMAEVATC